jgi:hypothetical protein
MTQALLRFGETYPSKSVSRFLQPAGKSAVLQPQVRMLVMVSG